MAERINWKKPLKIPPAEMKELTRKRDLIGFVQIFAEFGLAIGLGIAAYRAFFVAPWYVWLPLMYVYFIVFSWLGREGAFHELLHKTVFSSKQVNDVFFYIITFLGWMNGEYVRKTHLRHHHFTLFEGEDMDVALSLDFGPIDIFWALTFHFRHFVREVGRLIMTASGRLEGEYHEKVFPETDAKTRRRLRRDGIAVLVGHAVLLAVFIVTRQWILIPMISLGSFFATWPHLLVSMTQHVGMQRNVADFRICSRSIVVGPLMSFFYWRMQYHVEHHVYPAVPFYALKKLRGRMEGQLPRRKGLLEAWRDILMYLKRRKTDPGYYLPVELPPDT
jgi:fatty acid desaturase